MTEKEFYEEFGNIDPELIEAAAPKARKRKKILAVRLIAVAACLTVIIISAFMIVPQPVSYVVYADYSAGETLAEDFQNSKIPILSAAEKVFSNSASEKIAKPNDVADSVNFKFHGKEYLAKYWYTKKMLLFSSDKLNQLSTFNAYSADGVDLEFDAKGTLRFYLNYDINNLTYGNFTKSDAIDKAKEIASELYGEKFLDEYECSAQRVDSNTEKGYLVRFRKIVFGMQTMDSISIQFNMYGALKSVNARDMGLMTTAEEDLTQEEIDNAIKAFEDNYANNEGWDYSAPNMLVIDSEGDYYLRGVISTNRDGMVLAMQLYINVQ